MDNRQLLELHVLDCTRCKALLYENVALLLADDDGTLTDAQVVAVLDHLRKQHEGHTA